MSCQKPPVIVRIQEVDSRTVDIEIERRVKVGYELDPNCPCIQTALQVAANVRSPVIRGRGPRVRKVVLVHLVGGKRFSQELGGGR